MSQNQADLILEMARAFNSGYMRALEPGAPKNTTSTSYEQFVSEKSRAKLQTAINRSLIVCGCRSQLKKGPIPTSRPLRG